MEAVLLGQVRLLDGKQFCIAFLLKDKTLNKNKKPKTLKFWVFLAINQLQLTLLLKFEESYQVRRLKTNIIAQILKFNLFLTIEKNKTRI